MKMNIKGLTTKFDPFLKQIKHYKHYPNMIPWVGHSYGTIYKKVLFIGESHYLPQTSSAQLDITSWYESFQSNLNKEELEYINTRWALFKNFQRNGIWRNSAQQLIINGINPPPESNNVFEHFCYYNFFQRPAEKEGDQLHVAEMDISVANTVYIEVVKILEPEIIIFLSSKAYSALRNRSNLPHIIDFVPHPSSNWWNRKSLKYSIRDQKPMTGKEKFDFLISHLLNNNFKESLK